MSEPSAEKLRELGVSEDKIKTILDMSADEKIMLGVHIILHNVHKLENDIRSDVIIACLTFVEHHTRYKLLSLMLEDHKKKPIELLDLVMGCQMSYEEVQKLYSRLQLFSELFKDIK